MNLLISPTLFIVIFYFEQQQICVIQGGKCKENEW